MNDLKWGAFEMEQIVSKILYVLCIERRTSLNTMDFALDISLKIFLHFLVTLQTACRWKLVHKVLAWIKVRYNNNKQTNKPSIYLQVNYSNKQYQLSATINIENSISWKKKTTILSIHRREKKNSKTKTGCKI